MDIGPAQVAGKWGRKRQRGEALVRGVWPGTSHDPQGLEV